MRNRQTNMRLLNEYPEWIAKDQLYRICHISKRKAKYLLNSGLIPCIDSGKEIRRNLIQMKSVVNYLVDHESHPQTYDLAFEWRVPSSKFFNCKENEHIEGVRHTLQEWTTDEQKIAFLREYGWLMKDAAVEVYSAKFKPKE